MKDAIQITRPQLPALWGARIMVDNVNEALPLGLDLVKAHGVSVVSRGIETLEVPGPVSTIYRSPNRRVLFDEVRDANPFFHLMESMWILAGSDRVELPKYFLDGITRFSDDGVRFHGAYGYRLRRWPSTDDEGRLVLSQDQLLNVVDLLNAKPDTRQAVLSIWNPELDLGAHTKDVPCNDMIMLKIRDGHLHMTVCNRSNDVIWGAYGANAVQFSIIHEWLSVMVGVEQGIYTQQSDSFHVYPDNPFWKEYLKGNHDFGHVANPYMDPDVQPWPLAMNRNEAMEVMTDAEALNLMAINGTIDEAGTRRSVWTSPFFRAVVEPMITGYRLYRAGDHSASLRALQDIAAADWRAACTAWVLRRKERADAKKAGGL
jgi:hypothetical protein